MRMERNAVITTVEDTIPDDSRLALYFSTRYLQELQLALRLVGVLARYERPGIDTIMLPRLVVEHPERGELDEVICATRSRRRDGPNAAWWFEWRLFRDGRRERICTATDMSKAARIVAEQLSI